MARYATSFVVKAPQSNVYHAWVNAMETLVDLAPDRFRAFRVLQAGNGTRLTECVERWAGRDLTYRTRETLSPPGRAEQVVVDGHAKGSRTTWSFQPTTGGTRVDMDLRLRGFEGFILGVLMRGRFRKEMDETIALWAKAIEERSPSKATAV